MASILARTGLPDVGTARLATRNGLRGAARRELLETDLLLSLPAEAHPRPSGRREVPSGTGLRADATGTPRNRGSLHETTDDVSDALTKELT